MLKKSEIIRLVNDYIEVHGGYLGGFSYSSHAEFYPYYCDLDSIELDKYDRGTTRYTFINVLENVDLISQVKIINGVFKKFPVSSFPEENRIFKQEIYAEFQLVIARLEALSKNGVAGNVKNLIFAANGPKPELVLTDATTNEIQIVRNQEYCLVYQQPIPESGLTWKALLDRWQQENPSRECSRSELQNSLYKRWLSELLWG